MSDTAAQCVTLPSSDAAVTLVRGNLAPGIVGVIGSTLLRSLLIAGGMYVVGERAHLIRNSLGAAVAIEVFVLAWVAGECAKPPLQSQPGFP